MIALPRVRFAHLPTPIEALPRLSAALQGPRLFIKRDDQTGLALGGNKTRKLEFLVGEAQANGARMLITAGAAQSNHCRQTAAAAARFGLQCTLVLAGEASQPVSGNLLLDHLLGAKLVWTDWAQRDRVLQETFDRAWQDGKRPYLVPYGGSNPVGAAGYAQAMIELQSQWDAQPLGGAPDWIVFASSSGGTQAGLVVGARLVHYPGRVLGVSVDQPASELSTMVAQLASQTAERIQPVGGAYIDTNFEPGQILVDDSLSAAGYGVMGEPERQAITLFARTEGILLDPVYTGRAAAGMLSLVRQGFFQPDQRVLFWHTGGAPALFAERYRGLGSAL